MPRRLKVVIQSSLNLGKKGFVSIRKEGFFTFSRKLRRFLSAKIKKKQLASENKYDLWLREHENNRLPSIDTSSVLPPAHGPKISIITPIFDTDPVLLDSCILSVINQTYRHWELCLHNDGSTNKSTLHRLDEWKRRDSRIKVTSNSVNEGIAAASNHALLAATGEFIGLLDHDDELSPHALSEVAQVLNEFPETDLVYTDEDKISLPNNGKSERYDPFFKPAWDPQLLLSMMYIGHFSVYRKRLVVDLSGFRSEYNFSQDYDLALRATAETSRIKHIPKVLYHWRAIEGSAAAGGKLYAIESNLGSVKRAVEDRGWHADVTRYDFGNRVKFHIKGEPLVSIVVPSDDEKNVTRLLSSIQENTKYKNYEIIIVTNSLVIRRIKMACENNVRFLRFDESFNFSRKCNLGAMESRGDYLVFYNDDVLVEQPTWLEDLLSTFGRDKIGAVAPRLLYEDSTIQHAGLVSGVRGLVGTAFHCWPNDSRDYFNLAQLPRNVSLLSAACLMVPVNVFREIEGFDETNTPIMDSDVDFCLKLKEKGYELIYQPFSSLRHIGHQSIKHIEADTNQQLRRNKTTQYVLKRWAKELGEDPYYPTNMSEYLYEHGSPYYKLYGRGRANSIDGRESIAIFTHDLSLSGAPILLCDLACELKRRGFFVIVLSPVEGELLTKYLSEDIPVMIDATINEHELHPETEKVVESFDLAIINTVTLHHILNVCDGLGLPTIWLVHESNFGIDLMKNNRSAQSALLNASKILLPCKNILTKYMQSLDTERVEFVTSGIKSLTVPAPAKQNNEKFIILNVGSIEYRKGQDVLIASLLELSYETRIDVEIIFIGRILEDSFFEQLSRKISSAKLNCKFLGSLPHEDLPQYYNYADVLVCSSRDETGPLIILEAMSLSKPVISTNVGFVNEVIIDRDSGLIIPKEDPKAMAEAINLLYVDKDLRNHIGRRGLDRFRESYNFEHYADRFNDKLEAVLKRNKIC